MWVILCYLEYVSMVTPLPLLSLTCMSLNDQKLTTKTTLVQKLPNILVIIVRVRLKGRVKRSLYLT